MASTAMILSGHMSRISSMKGIRLILVRAASKPAQPQKKLWRRGRLLYPAAAGTLKPIQP